MSVYRQNGSTTHPRPLTQTEERIVQLLRTASEARIFFLPRDSIRQHVCAEYPGTGNIFGALEDLERDKIVARDERGWYHLVGVIYA